MAAARELASANLQITLIDRSNQHLFQPLLYQVATAGLSAPAIAAPIRHILAHKRNVTTLMATVTAAIDAAPRRILLEYGSDVSCEYLIVASGATHSYFGHDDSAKVAPRLRYWKTLLKFAGVP